MKRHFPVPTPDGDRCLYCGAERRAIYPHWTTGTYIPRLTPWELDGKRQPSCSGEKEAKA